MSFTFIFIILFIIIVVISIVKIIKESRRTGINFLPSGSMAENTTKVLNSYSPSTIKIEELVKNLAALKLSEIYLQMPTSNQVSFEMYPLLSWRGSDDTNSILKCYALAKPIKSDLQLTYRDVTQDAVIKTSEGLIESKFDGTKMIIQFQDRPYGSFDFESHKIFNTSNVEIGTFTLPDAINLKTSLMFDVQAFSRESAYEFISEISIGSSKIATVLLQPATFEGVEDISDRNQETDFPLFNDVKIKSSEEVVLILGFGISFLALLENTRSKRGEA